MTTTTVHRIDVTDLHTFRLRCRHCKHVSIAEVKDWASRGGRGICPKCETDWDDVGVALASLMVGLKTLCVRENPEVLIQVEVEAGAEAPAS